MVLPPPHRWERWRPMGTSFLEESTGHLRTLFRSVGSLAATDLLNGAHKEETRLPSMIWTLPSEPLGSPGPSESWFIDDA